MLRSWILQLEQEQAGRKSYSLSPNPPAPTPTLFASPEEVERARAAVTAAKRDEAKVTLPEVVPGYKANPLDAGEFPTLLSKPQDPVLRESRTNLYM